MEPDFTRRYTARVKVYKQNGEETLSLIEDIEVLGQDFEYAYRAAQDYTKLLIANSDWKLGEVLSLEYQTDIFIGIRKDQTVFPENGILKQGYKGTPSLTLMDKFGFL